jgi:hypothetical protein
VTARALHRGDPVQVHPHTLVDGRDLGGMCLTVHHPTPGGCACTESTGDRPVELAARDYDVLWRAG